MSTNEKRHPLFRGKVGHTVQGGHSYRYEVYVYSGKEPDVVHLFQDDLLWLARRKAIHQYNELILADNDKLVELNFTSVFQNDEVSVMELVSNAVNNSYANLLYGQLAEDEYTNHWMHTAAFELDMYLLFAYKLEGYLENLKYGYMDPVTGQLYGDINVLPGTGSLYNHPGLITEVTFKSHSLTDLKHLMNKKYK